jgi:recombinational DNA repair ATPase RecF
MSLTIEQLKAIDKELLELGRKVEAMRDRMLADLAEIDVMERRMAQLSRTLDGETVQ